ncbi:MAG: hypothetical protein PHH54_02515 [Candidatus Nanoarchaeia archaeon]|nr:hypothetical protein [Candidatus Nanoarchaeia archaeon]MDD5740834.1 hypothetical protein [Candidatus Nanoarchaeia archaeon]
MNFDLYMQGLPEQKDGELALSLSQDEMQKVANHKFRKTNAVLEFVTEIATSLNNPKTGVISSEKAAKFMPTFEQEREHMKNYAPNTEQKPMVQEDFYLDQAISIFWGFLKISNEKGRNLLMHIDKSDFNKNSEPDLFKLAEERVYGYCGIHSVSIEKVNQESNIYEGIIQWEDFIERWPNICDTWIAHPTPKEAYVKEKSGLYIRPKRINGLTNKYDFTLLMDFNENMKDYISETITSFDACCLL